MFKRVGWDGRRVGLRAGGRFGRGGGLEMGQGVILFFVIYLFYLVFFFVPSVFQFCLLY